MNEVNRNKNEGMDRHGVFFINVWRTIAATFIAFVAIMSIYSYTQNQLWYESWNKCVDAGGQPMETTVLGSDSRTFTCQRVK